MNYKMIFYTLGNILKVLAALLVFPLIVSLIYQDGCWYSFLITIGISLVLGFAIAFRKPKNTEIFGKEGLAVTGLAWIVISLIGCLPFIISGEIPSFIDAFFETVSGLTTTGSSILSNVEALSKSMLFWRSFTHWIGGMGVLVFVLAFLPSDAKSIHLLRAESPGPKVGKIVSKVQLTARILYILYGGLTIVEFIFLVCDPKMPVFDAICNSLATAGTGGFAITNAGIGGYSIYSQVVIGVFMILFGINFNLYYLLLLGKFKQVFKSEELWLYFGIILGSIAIITTNVCIAQHVGSFLEGLVVFKDAFFQVGAIITTTGFATVDFTTWPVLSQVLIFVLMFVGGMAGSTGGGMKVSRIGILFKKIRSKIRKLIHPHSVEHITFEGQLVDDEVVNDVSSYVCLVFVIFLASSILVSIDGRYDAITNITAVASCLNNIGPGLGQVGPMSNFGGYSWFSKLIFIANMLAGRLEIFPILCLFNPKLWKRS